MAVCRRTHQSLASVGVAALVRLVTCAGSHMSSSMWQEAVDMIAQAASDTIPQVADLVTPPPRLVLFTPADQLVSAALCNTLQKSQVNFSSSPTADDELPSSWIGHVDY